MSTCSQSNKDRIFVFDVDGTLTNEPTLLSPSLVSTISALAKQNLVIFATGRPYFGLSSIFLQIETLLPSVVLNGGGISLSDGVCSYGDPLNFNGLYTLSQKANHHTLFYFTHDRWFSNKINHHTEHEGKMLCKKAIQIDSICDIKKMPIYKIIAISKDQYHLELMQIIDCIGLDCSNSNTNYIELTNHGVNKGTALRLLLKQLKIDRLSHEIISFGDGINDIPLFQESDISYTFEKSKTSVKEEATHCIYGDSQKELVRSLNYYL